MGRDVDLHSSFSLSLSCGAYGTRHNRQDRETTQVAAVWEVALYYTGCTCVSPEAISQKWCGVQIIVITTMPSRARHSLQPLEVHCAREQRTGRQYVVLGWHRSPSKRDSRASLEFERCSQTKENSSGESGIVAILFYFCAQLVRVHFYLPCRYNVSRSWLQILKVERNCDLG